MKAILFLLMAGMSCFMEAQRASREKTTMQTAEQWKPTTDVRCDAVMCYGTADRPGQTFEQRVQTWRDRGYTVHFMTGIAWGDYQDYFDGRWDGKKHLDEGQVAIHNDSVGHGPMVPYIVPSRNYLKYFKERQIRRVIDAGIDAIFLEEPEFWVRSGYSDGFKREWQDYYGFPWRPQHESAENAYLSNKLKYFLYYRALDEVCSYAKEYGRKKGMTVRCYVPTHSLLNYSQWGLVSPEASLASLSSIDGYTAQVWTGTSRTPNYFNGEERERVFETAFLEYGCMESMTAPTGRKVFFLTDPVEDLPRDWDDFKRNYEATFTAQLLFPRNNNYEVMPWPDRIYEGTYRTRPDSDKREPIPADYATQMQIMVNALNHMPLSRHQVSGSQGIHVLMANSLMFQRAQQAFENYSDPQLSNFYGLSLPLLERGIPVGTVHIENTPFSSSWKGVKVLLMTYSNMKPLDPVAHKHIARWVKKGGVLIYCGRDDDPYQHVQEWWNKDGNQYAAPSEHLFELLNLPAKVRDGAYPVGKGYVHVLRKDPKEFVMQPQSDAELLSIVQKAYEQEAKAGPLCFKNSFYLERGPYDVAAVLDQSPLGQKPLVLSGMLIDLFHPRLPVMRRREVKPGERVLLFDLSRLAHPSKAQVVAAGARIYDEQRATRRYSFTAKGPLRTTNALRVRLPRQPKTIAVENPDGQSVEATHQWDEESRTSLLLFQNSPDGVRVSFTW